ncbi:hypothetical protein [Frankia sp. ACN1ag]|uniref:hypothetical protein n=1 Tax=Frankia sp. ACN1ag TaxID=102891 RepID=UPI0006DC888A|nr:hypothetical protein [Frankia sp. ACN1ag]KQC37863.1 hypothetical protein UK82_12705 [Frankia sp. ACN1ag]
MIGCDLIGQGRLFLASLAEPLVALFAGIEHGVDQTAYSGAALVDPDLLGRAEVFTHVEDVAGR